MHLNGFLTGEVHFGDRNIRIVDDNNPVWTMLGSRQLAVFASFLAGKSEKDPLAHSKLSFFGCEVIALLILGVISPDARGSIAASSAQGQRQLFSIIVQVAGLGG